MKLSKDLEDAIGDLGVCDCALGTPHIYGADSLVRVIEKALADARDEALEKACGIVRRATFADGKIQMDGDDLAEEIRRAYLAAAHPEGKHGT